MMDVSPVYAARAPAADVDADEAHAEFLAHLAQVKARRAAGAAAPRRKTTGDVDWPRLAAAIRSREPRRPARTYPTVPAPDRGPCPRCGASGLVGCSHYLPFTGDV